jgi:hypothetical protein
MAAVPDKEALRSVWQARFTKAMQADSWGQIHEAQEEYSAVASQIAAKQSLPSITSKEKDVMHRLSLCLSARAEALKTFQETVTSTDMKSLEPVFLTLFTGSEPEVFPVDPSKYQHAAPVIPNSDEIVCGEVEELTPWAQHQAVLRNVSGTVVSLQIDKIGLKDAQDYIDPFMTVLVADERTNILDSHDTPIGKERRATHVIFEHPVFFNISLEDMRKQGAALFFEFKHYKPKKKKVSTRCWAFMELDELKCDEEIVLEIYHKPTDLKKKKINLHSEKPLYLHMTATFVHS